VGGEGEGGEEGDGVRGKQGERINDHLNRGILGG